MGRSVTHKAIICYKSLVEKKPTSQVAQETFHSPEDVEHYVQSFRRICQQQPNTEPFSQSQLSHSAIGRSQLWLSQRPALRSRWHV
jgi:Protein of unknown function (DUF1670)